MKPDPSEQRAVVLILNDRLQPLTQVWSVISQHALQPEQLFTVINNIIITSFLALVVNAQTQRPIIWKSNAVVLQTLSPNSCFLPENLDPRCRPTVVIFSNRHLIISGLRFQPF